MQVGGEAARGQRGGHPAQRGAGRRARELGHLGQPGLVDAGDRQRLGQAPGLGDPEVLEALEHRVLGVGGVEALELRALLGAHERLALQGDEPLGVVALDARPPRTRRASRR